MKKQLLLISMAVSVGLAVNAQSTKRVINPRAQMKNPVAVPTSFKKVDAETASNTKATATHSVKNIAKKTSSSDNPHSVAQTTYELHANTGLAVRNGGVSVVVTGSTTDINATSGATWADRGTFYNYYNPTSGWGASPTARLESIRTGWPDVAVTKSGKEIVISHDAATGDIVILTRPVAGTGSWTTLSGHGLTGFWPRVAVGGPDGESVHLITSAQDGSNFTLYHRSLDGGATWAIKNQVLPGMNSAGGYERMNGNDYAIDVRGNVVAIASAGSFNDVALWKSTDNGATFTRTVIWDFPIDNYNPKGNITDADSDGVADTLENTDGYVEILLDKNNQAHWWAGYGRILDNNAATTDSGWFYFPGLNGLLYWNESWGPDTVAIIAGAPDVNGNGSLDYTAFQTYNGPTLASMATAALDTVNGTILVALSSPTEGDTIADGNVYRDIYYITSTDGGVTWTETDTTARLTKSPGEEDVYPVLVNFTDNAVPSNWNYFPAIAAWQRGYDPGSFFSNPSRPIEANDYLVYLPMGAVGIAEVSNSKDFTVSQNYPNPFSNETTISVAVSKPSTLTLEVYSVMGQKVMERNADNVTRSYDFKVKKSDLGAGVYFYTVKSGSNAATGKMIVE